MHELPGSSPLSFVGGGFQYQQQQNQQQYQPQKAPVIEPATSPETNAERNYRDAANLCEVVVPITLGSAVVFAFHSMQVAGGAIIPIGIYSIYLGAKLGNPHRRWSTAIIGLGVTGGMLASLAEPIGEAQQQQSTQTATETAIRDMHPKKISKDSFLGYLPSIALAAIIIALILKGRKQWLTAKHAQLLKSNRALLLAFESLPQVAKLSAVSAALTLGIYGGAMALRGTASDRVQICIRNKQALRCQDKSGAPYLMTKYHAEQWKANGVPKEVVFGRTIPATNPHKALWMLLSATGFGIASAGFRSLQNSERQLANYEVIAEKRDLAKGEMSARAELLESLRSIAIGELHLQADLEAAANDRAVVLKQCEVLGEADIKIAAMDAEEAVFDAETAGLSDEKKREYMDFLRAQKTPFLLNGTQTLDSINNPSDKVGDGDGAVIEPTDGPKIPTLTWYPSVLIYGAPGSGKSTFAAEEIAKRKAAGHRVIVLDPHAAFGAWAGCEVVGGGMNYGAIDSKLAWFALEVGKRYKRVQTEPNPTFEPLTFVCDEFTRWGTKCANSAEFFEQLVTDIRKVEMFGVIISHTRTLAGLANAKGFASLRDEALLEIEILGNQDAESGRATPRFEVMVKLPGQSLGDRTLVKIPKHSAPGVENSTPKLTLSDSEYLERAWKMEFDLGPTKPSDSPPDSADATDSTSQNAQAESLLDGVSGVIWSVRKVRELYLDTTPEQLFESVSASARSGESVRTIIKSVLKCREGNEHQTRSYSGHGKTLLRWLIENYDDGSIANLPEIKKFLAS